MSQTSDLVRARFTEGDNIRDAGLTTPEDIRRFDDIPYGPDPHWQVLDVYRPRAADGQKLPVIVSVHGGGWVYGDKERYQFYCMNLAQRGFAVVNFTYRLAPEFQFPAPLEDTNLVFAWVLTHGEAYGFDTGHVFGVGDSAGGHLLGLYADFCTNPGYSAQFSFQPPEGFVPTAVALNCGVYQIATDGENDDLNRLLMADLLPEHGTPEELAGISVIRYVTPQFPPTFFMTATGDFLQDQTPLLQAALMANSVPFVLRFYGDAARPPLGHVFHCNIKTEDARQCNDEECGFFRNFL
ncbi:MAG: alpha/beta hydrolase [Clostridiales bacterium]|nr:alpha/beta hydrolase [Clostridiales bacterium]